MTLSVMSAGMCLISLHLVVPQSFQGLGILVIDPFFETLLKKIVGWVEIRGVGWLCEVSASRKDSTTTEISAEYREISRNSKGLSEYWAGAPSCW